MRPLLFRAMALCTVRFGMNAIWLSLSLSNTVLPFAVWGQRQ